MKKIIYALVFVFLLPLDAVAVSFSADAVQIRNGDFSHARMFWTDKRVRFEYLDQGVAMVQIYDTLNKKVIWLDTENKVFLERDTSVNLEEQTIVKKKSVIKNPCEMFSNAQCTRLKEATVNGRNTVKWLVTLNVQGNDTHIFQWLDKQYGIIIKQESSDGSFLNTTIEEDIEVNGRKARKVDMYAVSQNGMVMQNIQWYDNELGIVIRQVFSDGSMDELRNIKVKKIAASLFEIPKGYSKVEQPVLDQPMLGQSEFVSQPAAFKFIETQNN